MPYFCHIHNGLYVNGDEEGCQAQTCIDLRARPSRPLGMIPGTVKGGHNWDSDAQYRYHAQFDEGLERYQKAKKVDGIQPSSTTVEGVEKTYDKVKRQKKALDKIKKEYGADASELKTLPGVE